MDRRRSALVTASAAALAAASGVFLFSCFAAASDAQGALIFILLGPVVLLLLAGALVLVSLPASAGSGAARTLRWLSAAGLGFVVAFFALAFIPPARPFPAAVIGAVAAAYEAVTGESPYAAARRGNDVGAMIDAALAASSGERLDLSALPTAKPWDRVCVLRPYTDNAAARPVLGLEGWDIEMYSAIATSDSICTLVFIDGKRVSYVYELPRGKADLASLGGRCFARAAARLARSRAALFLPSADR